MRRAMTRGEFTRAMHSDPRDAIARRLARERERSLTQEANHYTGVRRSVARRRLRFRLLKFAATLTAIVAIWVAVFYGLLEAVRFARGMGWLS